MWAQHFKTKHNIVCRQTGNISAHWFQLKPVNKTQYAVYKDYKIYTTMDRVYGGYAKIIAI
jgi:hypothetical protein